MIPSPSTTQLLINNWQQFADCLKRIQHSDAIETPTLALTEGPWQDFLNLHLAVYAQLAKIRLNLSVKQNDSIKNQIPPDLLQTASTITLQDINQAFKKLEKLIQEHYQQLVNLQQEIAQTLVFQLSMQQLTFNELEIEQIKVLEPSIQLQQRVTELSLTLPAKRLALNNFKAYWWLKSYLTVHSCLARQHQTHETSDIEKILKKIASVFTDYQKKLTTLLKEQQQTIKATIALGDAER